MFEHLGYYKEYYINSKFIGMITCEKDREIIGFIGRKKEITKETIILSNNKKIKSGIEVTTLIYPLSGKQIR